MFDVELRIDCFVEWVVQHEYEVIGVPCSWLDDPLSRWLFDLTGRLYGVDSTVYGSVLLDTCYWRRLPSWCQLFVLLTEKHAFKAMTGFDVFHVLVDMEQRHKSVLLAA